MMETRTVPQPQWKLKGEDAFIWFCVVGAVVLAGVAVVGGIWGLVTWNGDGWHYLTMIVPAFFFVQIGGMTAAQQEHRRERAERP